ncbi:MAG: BadF/BadG/BcrA/BcrD ATPase family protein [Lentisphaerae bacterium ADurb.BinA184]|nr:MAG: BadF/BadG/BcrA/BcrD ATPase family protein [Lentisphaerae bacterium ADurb.BinA184]
MASQTILVGLDGGASKTAAVCCDGDGRILATSRGPRCAIVGPPSPDEAAVLDGVAGALCRTAGIERTAVTAWGVGLSGIDYADEFDAQWLSVAAALGVPAERVTLVNDAIPALWGATSVPAAAILQHGSGVTSAWRRALGDERLFDHLDVGRQFDIRHALLAAVARMLDGRREPTGLRDRTLAHLGIADSADYAEAIYRGRIPWARRMSTAPLVYDAWLADDAAAEELVTAAIEDYAQTAAALGRRTGDARPEIALGGGVIACAPEAFWTRLAAAVAARLPDARVRRPALAAEFGAAIMAAFRHGDDACSLFERLSAAPGKEGAR